MPASRATTSFIFVTLLLDIIGFGLVIPVMPQMVAKFTTNDIETNNWFMVMTASYGIMQFFFSPILGALSDKFGRRPILLISIVGLGGNFLLQGIAWSIPILLIARILGGITGASISVGSAYIADVTTAENRAKGFGILGMAFGIGFILGPMFGGLLGQYKLEYPFFAAAAFSLLNALYGFFVLPESLPKHKRSNFSLKKANAFSALKDLSEFKGLGLFILAIALTNLAQFMTHSVWVRYTEVRFHWTPRDNGIALFCVGISAAIVQGGLLGPLVRKFGEIRLAKIGLFFATLEFLLFGLSPHGGYLFLVLAVCFLANVAGPALQSQVSRVIAPEKQGIAMGSLASIASLSQVIAPFVALTILSQSMKIAEKSTIWIGLPFFTGAALQFIALAIAIIYFVRRENSSRAMPVANL